MNFYCLIFFERDRPSIKVISNDTLIIYPDESMYVFRKINFIIVRLHSFFFSLMFPPASNPQSHIEFGFLDICGYVGGNVSALQTI